MLWAGSTGGLELRSEGGETHLRGTFPYSRPTVLADGPERRQETFAARAFGPSIEAGGDIHLLAHHDFDRPLASRDAGTLTLTDGDDALTFEARISPEMRSVGYVKDILTTLSAGLVGGISPGFRVPEGGSYVRREGRGVLRVVERADLVEVSIVTKPAYPSAQVEARSWTVSPARRPTWRVPL
ncbi:MAG: HK97 family phage prohead protease [Pseudomonadota bacterium]